ncbi:MAG: hypothetical protein H0T76_23720 [Nannocystis sp.]|nr:hypothetical protein [Nannocystis sp.]MBA3549495.1 hypothetical protein [Nannocystis sp.]
MQVSKSLIALVSVFAATVVTTDASANKKKTPSAAAIAFAQETSDLMTNTVVAALLQEIGETTPDNVKQGNLSIGLIFDDANLNMRLVGELDPLRDNDYPRDDFEEDALAKAMAGMAATSVEKVSGKWYYRRSIPLSNFAPQCALCHDNFVGLADTEYVGALMLRIPIAK